MWILATDEEAEIGGELYRTDRHDVRIAYISIFLGECWRHLNHHLVLGDTRSQSVESRHDYELHPSFITGWW
jgi:hypothetical protein